MWCIVGYINPPPTLCRSKQTLRLLFVVLPQQYFYLSCETAIQIDEVQQHDIFCTSITLRGWATWVKSQQTITFPDISSPHSDRWWILPDKAFIIAANRECTKISSLFFSPPSSAFPVQIDMNSAAEAEWSPVHTHRRKGGGGINVKSLQDIYCQSKSISLLQGRQMMVQWAEGHIKWKQLFSASSDPILPQWEGLLWKWAMMACHRRLAFIIYLGVQCTEAQWLKTHIESPHVAGPQPNPSPPPPKSRREEYY